MSFRQLTSEVDLWFWRLNHYKIAYSLSKILHFIAFYFCLYASVYIPMTIFDQTLLHDKRPIKVEVHITITTYYSVSNMVILDKLLISVFIDSTRLMVVFMLEVYKLNLLSHPRLIWWYSIIILLVYLLQTMSMLMAMELIPLHH